MTERSGEHGQRGARLCLKARPTPTQLADRLVPVDGSVADGLELYLDVADIASEEAMATACAALEAQSLPADFALLIEGPVGSLDGEFFDVTRQSAADEAVVDRLAEMARRIGARAVNIHLIAPSADTDRLTLDCRAHLLKRALPFLRRFAGATLAAGAIPTLENMPPVLRMRQGGYYFTPIGMAAEDIRQVVDRVEGLKVLPDTSHAGLYLNARAVAEGRREIPSDAEDVSWLKPFLAFVRALPEEPRSLLGYFEQFSGLAVNAQVSNASGLLGEGQRYPEGDFDLNPTIRWLNGHVEHIVTETLEPDPDVAETMREALRCLRKAVA